MRRLRSLEQQAGKKVRGQVAYFAENRSGLGDRAAAAAGRPKHVLFIVYSLLCGERGLGAEARPKECKQGSNLKFVSVKEDS